MSGFRRSFPPQQFQNNHIDKAEIFFAQFFNYPFQFIFHNGSPF